MSRFCFCNCPAGFNAAPERHAPDCPGRSGAGKPRAVLIPSTQPKHVISGVVVMPSAQDDGVEGRGYNKALIDVAAAIEAAGHSMRNDPRKVKP
jgi:hypothetical protein